MKLAVSILAIWVIINTVVTYWIVSKFRDSNKGIKVARDIIDKQRYIISEKTRKETVLDLIQKKLNDFEQEDFDKMYDLHEKGQNLFIIMTNEIVEKGSTVII